MRGLEIEGVPDSLVAYIDDHFGKVEVQWLVQHASSRRYIRFFARSGDSLVAMLYSLTPDELGASPESHELPFLNVHRFLAAKNVPIPKVIHQNEDDTWLLLEDLGSRSFEDSLLEEDADWRSLYSQAIETMAAMHESAFPIDAECIASAREFNEQLLWDELEHFRQWGIAPFVTLSHDDESVLTRTFEKIVERVGAVEQGFVHRDFQSRNLMWRRDELVVIDFQDALLGPRTYDLAALLCDSYVEISDDLRDSMLAYYAKIRGVDVETLREDFFWVALHRKLKDAGRFVFIDRVRRNPAFLCHYPPSFTYIHSALKQLGLKEIQRILEKSLVGYPNEMAVPPSVCN